MTVTMSMTLAMIPRLYWAFVKAEELYLEQEMGQLQELLEQQNSWVSRNLGCGMGAFILVWFAKTTPGMEVPRSLAGAMAIYAASSLLFAALESLLAQKISRILSSAQVRVKERDQE